MEGLCSIHCTENVLNNTRRLNMNQHVRVSKSSLSSVGQGQGLHRDWLSRWLWLGLCVVTLLAQLWSCFRGVVEDRRGSLRA